MLLLTLTTAGAPVDVVLARLEWAYRRFGLPKGATGGLTDWLGVTPETVRTWRKRKGVPAKVLQRVGREVGMDPLQFVAPVGSAPMDADPRVKNATAPYQPPRHEVRDAAAEPPRFQEVGDNGSEFVLVPQLDVHVSAGAGAVVEGEEEIGRFAFRRSWITRRGWSGGDLRVVTARGDSMEPTVRSGDILLVDTAVHRLGPEGIYLINHEGELKCKRLQSLIDGTVAIRSDNPRYAEERLSAGQAEQLLRVVAKVVWIGGER
jgi:phage repressor protein C with HTH and peptisase S24 domain